MLLKRGTFNSFLIFNFHMEDQIQKVFEKIDEDEALSLAKQFIAIPSPPGREGPVGEFMAQWMTENGLSGRLQEIGPERYNAVGRIKGVNPAEGKSLMYNGHLDTSQGGLDPHDEYLVYGELSKHKSWQPVPYMEDGRLYGAGSSNCKGNVSTFLIAAKAIKDAGVELNNDLILAGVAAETGKAEIDQYQGPKYRGHGIGTQQLLNSGVTSDYAIVVESSRMLVSYALPGVLYFKLTVKGHPAYIPYIDNERHPIYKALPIIDAIRIWGEKYTEDNVYTFERGQIRPNVNVGSIRSGAPPKPNYQPAVLNMYVDVRTSPARSPLDVEKEFRTFVRGLDPEIDVVCYRSQTGTAPEASFVEDLSNHIETSYRAVYEKEPIPLHWEQHSRWHDVIIYHEHGIPCVKCGPGPGPEHSDITRRSLSPDELVKAAKMFAATALSICQVAE